MKHFLIAFFGWALFGYLDEEKARAVDFTHGETLAVPVGKAPVVDGDLSDWDLSAAEPVYISAQTAEKMHAEWAVMYDDEAVYFCARVSMPDRPYTNTNNPQDGFWSQDILQVRMSSDPALPYPLDGKRDATSDRINHISFWKNSQTGRDYLQITCGAKMGKGSLLNPPGSAVKLVTDGDKGYVMEAKVPWSALNVPGGKIPFKPGESAAFVAETLWIGGDKSRVALDFRTNPGVFAFSSLNCWGKLTFADKSPGKRVRPTMEEVLAAAKAEATRTKPQIGTPFEVNVPDDGIEVSINILGKNGAVLREIMGGEAHPKGKLTAYWDGHDAFGKVVPMGTYSWGAYFHRPIKAEYQGGVGSSGKPFYKTLDGTGGWGGDHSDPIDAASDADSLYLLWPVAEAGQALVKADMQGNVVWRKTPYVGGGFGPFYSVAVDGNFVYLARGTDEVFLSRLDAKTGGLQTWGDDGPGEVSIYKVDAPVAMDRNVTPAGMSGKKWEKLQPPEGKVLQPDPMGLAVRDGVVFMSCYSGNKIYSIDALTGKVLGELICPGPRGLAFDPAGNLLAVSYVPGQTGKVMRFVQAKGDAVTLADSNLEAPYDMAVAKDGTVAVTDLGKSQQIKVFDQNGKFIKALGNPGGRAWQGKYDAKALSFLQPSGLTVDAEGVLVVAETSPPKVFSRIRLSDGELVNRWFGAGVYWNGTWPMPDNPRNIFYQVNHAICRADLGDPDHDGVPNAFWSPAQAGYPSVGDIDEGLPQPETVKAANGELYLVRDVSEHAIYLLKDDKLRPVATWQAVPARDKSNPLRRPCLKVWIDQNGDGQMQDNEQSVLSDLAAGKPMPSTAGGTSSMHMEPNGNLYFTSSENCIVEVPATGFGKDGTIQWDTKKASLAVPVVMPGQTHLDTGYRHGMQGVRVDSHGDIYTLFNARLKGGEGEYDYPDEAYAKRMLEGMGHTSSFNAVKFAKFDPQGSLLWMAGRKATAGAAPGEMYHFWNMAGLINDKYIAGGSEWGQIYFYTQDGFFVDALMNNPGDVMPPGPYTFGGETSGGRATYFSATGELWVYSSGMAYKVSGFSQGSVEKESRASGSVKLDQVYRLPEEVTEAAGPLVIVRLKGDPMKDIKVWDGVPFSTLKKSDKPLAEAKLGYDDKFFYARITVSDNSPLQNGASESALAFKSGDTAGIVLGPDRKSEKPAKGDVRFMAAMVGGKPELIAMKAVTGQFKKPFVYETPAGGKAEFEFVGEVPGAGITLEKNGDGYVALMAIPRTFLEFDLAPGAALHGDLEIRLSGAGQRGLQAVSRNYLFTPDTSSTSMVDDIPTESRLYPQYWGPVEVK